MHSLVDSLLDESVRVPALRRIFQQHRHAPSFEANVLSALSQLEPDAVWKAAWLLVRKAEVEGLSAITLRRLIEQIDCSDHWTWKLLVCQLFARVRCPVELQAELYPFLIDCTTDRRVIIRAWAVSSLWQMKDIGEFRKEIGKVMQAANRDQNKSMIARLKHLKGIKAQKTQRK